MSEDYLAKSGAKDMIATAIAEVLTLRPRVPVAFLASQYVQHPVTKYSPLLMGFPCVMMDLQLSRSSYQQVCVRGLVSACLSP
ncbi:hypothetical protein F443_20956 [Phytophthora nicotianae P1569]|uniref:Uncharacterized protein n=2 Tax=Phytophthora nicotianae TaxID=4792 RepID=V9E0U4_PHYNI|nr:hypothetical protein F443_20956 [Phytophthora nicotianae P1569]ETO60900.1 hypothetical protein F444_20961 [Phytophthora nicotianae P1976]